MINAKHAKRLRRAVRRISNLPAEVTYNEDVVKTVPHVELRLAADGTSQPFITWVEKRKRTVSPFSQRYLYLSLKRRPNGRLSAA